MVCKAFEGPRPRGATQVETILEVIVLVIEIIIVIIVEQDLEFRV